MFSNFPDLAGNVSKDDRDTDVRVIFLMNKQTQPIFVLSLIHGFTISSVDH